MRFLKLAALALALPAAGLADTKPIPTVPYGEAKPAGFQAPAPVTAAPAPVLTTPAPIPLPPGGTVVVPPLVPLYVPVLPPVVPPATPAVVLPDGATRIIPIPVPALDGTIRFGPGTTLGERLQYWSLVHNHAPDGTPKPVGTGNFYTDMKWIFGSSRQFFGTAASTVGHGRNTREP
jgi:hypothetical protein